MKSLVCLIFFLNFTVFLHKKVKKLLFLLKILMFIINFAVENIS